MPENEPPSEPSYRDQRTVDTESLKALAHPLRVQIFNTLSTYGQFTASGLAERLGESSGATSYHLRQLEKHRFVREVEGKGTGRERWWERTPGVVTFEPRGRDEPASAQAAARLVERELARGNEALLNDYLTNRDQLSDAWLKGSTQSIYNVHLTAEQLAALSAEVEAFVKERTDPFRTQRVVGSRPVQIQLNAFPVIDGTEITEKDAS
jgi:DNA-binding transcriptional ArsR family regulator